MKDIQEIRGKNSVFQNWLFRVVSKEGHADNLLGHERTITIEFFEKGATVNNASYCQLLRQNSTYLLNDPCIYKNNLFWKECKNWSIILQQTKSTVLDKKEQTADIKNFIVTIDIVGTIYDHLIILGRNIH